MSRVTVNALQKAAARFRDERDWQQFHSPKNLAIALSVEASELLELFLWREDEAGVSEQRIADEMADIFLYLLSLADVTNIDLAEAAEKKLAANAEKYPADLVRGRADKYTEYDA